MSDRAPQRLRLDLRGAVQGVGFRPFVHRLATSEGLAGFVRNTGEGASLEIEGPAAAVDRFMRRLASEIAAPAAIHEQQVFHVRVRGERDFAILASEGQASPATLVLPDLATCAECLQELHDPQDRRHRYPFTTCMHCGPRYSLVEAAPYDRERTTMRHFPMCPACRAEYEDPASRRFHAETIACPECGPQLALWDRQGRALAMADEALMQAARALRDGAILALKGLGGFQLLADARNDRAVQTLRERKRRPAKPFALMVRTLDDARVIAHCNDEECLLLASPAAPIVLLRAKGADIAAGVAPDNPYRGVMLPTTPLHHLLMTELGFPVVATSGNPGNEPIVADEHLALQALGSLADVFLVHDRRIFRPVDDSVVRVIEGRPTVLRCARGYAPLPLDAPWASRPMLALGGHQKASVAVAAAGRIVLGPHIGDLDSGMARACYARAIDGMTSLYRVKPQAVTCDLHPDYHSTRVAAGMGLPVQQVPHHLAHVLAGIADNRIEGAVLGIAWDGNGYGEDGMLWGGECLSVEGMRHERVVHFLPFRLPGGELAMREPRRAALGALHAVHASDTVARVASTPLAAAWNRDELAVLARMLERGVHAPWTSSAGRLFDAVAALLGLVQRARFEGEAAMAVEFAADRADSSLAMPAPEVADVIDWRPMLAGLVDARCEGVPKETLAAAFHQWLVMVIVAVARRHGIRQVLLTGGCFQNARLTVGAVRALREAGFVPYWHHRVPPNDGGLAVGQLMHASLACRAEVE